MLRTTRQLTKKFEALGNPDEAFVDTKEFLEAALKIAQQARPAPKPQPKLKQNLQES